MSYIFEKNAEAFLSSYNVDIHNHYYKSSENYLKVKDTRIVINSPYSMPLEEFIERYLLSEQEVIKTYESIYEMGNPYKFDDKDCEDIAVAEEIILNEPVDKESEKTIEEIVNNFVRPRGLIDRLNTYLGIDLESFPNKDKKYKRERCKILYLFYTLEKKYAHTNVLMLLGNPSMENIDNSFIGMQTHNGEIIKLIKESLEKELPLATKEKIKKDIARISTTWDAVMENAYYLMDFMYENEYGYKYDFEETINILRSNTGKSSKNGPQYTQSPIELLYLKITQHEYIGNMKDIRKLNEIEKDYTHNIPPELVAEMKVLHYNHIDINNFSQYLHKNALRLSKYVYFEKKPNKEDVRRIRNAKEKFLKWLNFGKRANPLLNPESIHNELQLVSFLQAVILDDSNETFDYAFHGHNKYFSHMPHVQAALKNDNPVPDALQCYWIRKVADRWYANIGKYDARTKTRRLERVCDDIREEILNKPSLDEMWEIHNFYFDEKLDDALITTRAQIQAVQRLQDNLYKKGFTYVDHFYLIRYAFLYPPEIKETYVALITMINETIKDYKPSLSVNAEVHSADGKVDLIVDFQLDFDYKEQRCIMQQQSFDLRQIQ